NGDLSRYSLRDIMHDPVAAFVQLFFEFNAAATPEFYTLSLRDALPICSSCFAGCCDCLAGFLGVWLCCCCCSLLDACCCWAIAEDRKSTRLNSSHVSISYAVFCLKKKQSTPTTKSASSALRPSYLNLRS